MRSTRLAKLIVGTVPDRPGFVADTVALAHRAPLNVRKLSGSLLGGDYSLSLVLEGHELAFESFERELPALDTCARWIVRDATPCAARASARATPEQLFVVSAFSYDERGIAAAVLEQVRRCGGDAKGIAGSTYAAAEQGIPLWMFEAKVALPDELDTERFARSLCRWGESQGWDISLRPYRPLTDERPSFQDVFPPSRARSAARAARPASDP
ncbi:MAG: hypothetical protein IT454_20475 [Planctomycetes bacterium]|nr:hypothetical protein [Planctomycetota bacterium]